jgi:hypothetical protein
LEVAILKTKKEIWRVAVSGCVCETDDKDGDEEKGKK